MRLFKQSRQCCDVPITQHRVVCGGFLYADRRGRVMDHAVRSRARIPGSFEGHGVDGCADGVVSRMFHGFPSDDHRPDPRRTARFYAGSAWAEARPRAATGMIQVGRPQEAGSRIKVTIEKGGRLSQQRVYGSGGRRGTPRRHRIGNGRVEPTSRRKETHT